MLEMAFQGREYPFGLFGSAPSQLLVHLVTGTGWEAGKSLTWGKHNSATTKTSVCYRHHSPTESITQHSSGYWEENFLSSGEISEFSWPSCCWACAELPLLQLHWWVAMSLPGLIHKVGITPIALTHIQHQALSEMQVSLLFYPNVHLSWVLPFSCGTWQLISMGSALPRRLWKAPSIVLTLDAGAVWQLLLFLWWCNMNEAWDRNANLCDSCQPQLLT